MENSNTICWYNSVDIFHGKRGNWYKKFESQPGFTNFRHMFGFFAANFSSTDRTNSIKLPIKTTLLPQCKLPKFEKVNTDFGVLCEQRARWLLDHAIKTNRKLAIMYSGGIDSTLVMVSLLKIATDEEIKNHTVCLLSNVSIAENKNFYDNYIIKKFPIQSSYQFYAFLGNDNYITVSGEGGDQLFGSAVIDGMFKSKGVEFIFGPPKTEEIVNIFNTKIRDLKVSEKITEVLDKLVKNAEIEINNVYQYFWWINFAMKWQSVYARTIAYTDKRFQGTIKPEDNYFIFFSPEDMQLWVMNNTDKLIRDSWASYKYISKDIIYEFNKDTEYRDNKVKVPSLQNIVATKPIAKCLGSDMKFYNDDYPSPEIIWDPNNDFI